jgi:SPASM domain peptide maturase of grasp-with-spasm system
VNGYQRAVICDLIREELFLIPKRLAAIIKDKIFDISDIPNDLSLLFSELMENDMFTKGTKKELANFPVMSKKWDYPAQISNMILFYSAKQNYKKLVQVLEEVGCKYIQIVFFRDIKVNKLNDVLNHFIESRLSNIELVFSKDPCIKWQSVLKNHSRVTSVTIFESENTNNPNWNLIYYNKKLSFEEKSKISISSLIVNTQLYTESIKFNTFYNRKVIIDGKGKIKRTILDSKDFGSVYTEDLTKIVRSIGFQKFWHINKDKIKVCKDCEFRYCCIDDRLPLKTKKKNGLWYFNSTCNYNPYTLKWKNGADETTYN